MFSIRSSLSVFQMMFCYQKLTTGIFLLMFTTTTTTTSNNNNNNNNNNDNNNNKFRLEAV